MRPNTERPITITEGTNELIGQDFNRLRSAVTEILDGRTKPSKIPPLWDGHAGDRIAAIITGPADTRNAPDA